MKMPKKYQNSCWVYKNRLLDSRVSKMPQPSVTWELYQTDLEISNKQLNITKKLYKYLKN